MNTRGSKGGRARAAALTPQERQEIATRAAAKRHNIPVATHAGELEIGNAVLPCAVLEDGTRVLSETGIAQSLGSRSGASKRQKYAAQAEGRAPLPLFLSPKRLEPYIDQKLIDGPLKPLKYAQGRSMLTGYDASALPIICDIWLQARDAGRLQKQQLGKAQKAEMLMRGLAHIGIIALVDEATGYQELRDRLALQALLDRYLRKELAAWAKKFPDEFYKQIFRLRGWQWKGMKVNRPSVVGKYTNDIVYERIAPELLAELERKNPRTRKGRRKAKHHQWLTEDIGEPALAQHLHAVIGLMRASSDWTQFKILLRRAFPKKGRTLELPLSEARVE